MIYKRIGLKDLIEAICKRISSETGFDCSGTKEESAIEPYCFVDIAKVEAEDTDTMYIDVFTVKVHAVEGENAIDIYAMIDEIQAAMSKEFLIESSIDNIIMQKSGGIDVIEMIETNRKHAVMSYEFKVAYGEKRKI